MDLSIRFMFVFALSALVTMLPELAMASSSLDGTIGEALCKVVEIATGTTGKAIATAAIVFLGIGAFFGKVNWGLAMMVAVGIILIFGGATIAEAIADTDAQCAYEK